MEVPLLIVVELGQKQPILQLFLSPQPLISTPPSNGRHECQVLYLGMSVIWDGSLVTEAENSLRNVKQHVCFKYLEVCCFSLHF